MSSPHVDPMSLAEDDPTRVLCLRLEAAGHSPCLLCGHNVNDHDGGKCTKCDCSKCKAHTTVDEISAPFRRKAP
jgi:hypothetical protein